MQRVNRPSRLVPTLVVLSLVVVSLVGLPGSEGRLLGSRAFAVGRSVGGETADPSRDLDAVRDRIDAGEYGEAVRELRRRLATAEESFGGDAPALAPILDLLVMALLYAGEGGDDKTLELARRAVAMRETTAAEDPGDGSPAAERILGRTTSYLNLGSVLHYRGESEKARPWLDRALRQREAALGPDHPDLVPLLIDIAGLHYSEGELARARSLFERALRLSETALGPEHPDVAQSLDDLAVVLGTLGEYEPALRRHERALAIREKTLGPDHPAVGVSLINVAAIRERLGDFDAALALYRRALEITRERLGPDHPQMGYVANNLGLLLQSMGETVEARSQLERALAIREAALGPDHPDLSATLNNLGHVLEEIGDLAGARPYFERAVAIQREGHGPDHPSLASALVALASWHLRAGEPEPAQPLLEEALSIYRRLSRLAHPNRAIALEVLGRLRLQQGRLAEARDAFSEAVEIREKALGDLVHPDLAEELAHLGDAQRRLGDLEAAERSLRRALDIQTESLGSDHPAVAESLADLALVQRDRGRPGEALALALQAERVRRDHVARTLPALPERQALGYALDRPRGLGLAVSLAAKGGDPGAVAGVWDGLVRSRALVLDEMSARHRFVGRTESPEIRGLWRDFTTARQRLANLYVRGPGDGPEGTYRRLLDESRAETERAEQALAAASAPFRRELAARRVGLAEVEAALPADGALVAFLRSEDRYLAFVLAPELERPAIRALGPEREIEDRIARWRREVTGHSETRYRRAGERLREAIWDPVAPLTAGARRVFVVPDGALHLVSFAALPVEDGGYLVEREPVLHYLSAERDLVVRTGDGPAGGRGRASPRREGGLLALGAVAFDAPVAGSQAAENGAGALSGPGALYRGPRSACEAFRTLRFERLPGTGAEVRTVAEIWREHQGAGAEILRLTGVEGRESAFKRLASGRRVIHLATHGFVLGAPCAVTDRTTEIHNPLLLSGLALAGANRREQAGPDQDDGILTAEEIASLDLSAVDWAVLSACNTGGGAIRGGEGVLGLRRAFRIAGVRTLILSLWRVDDALTTRWMSAFYRARLERDRPTAEAVRAAQLELLAWLRSEARSTHPFHWAAFVAEG